MGSRKYTIFVTGSLGWLGKNLLSDLCRSNDILGTFGKDYKIKAFLLENEDPSFIKKLSKDIEIFKGSLLSPTDCNAFFNNSRKGILIHTVGVIHPKITREFFSINFKTTQNALNAAIASRTKRAIVISSNSPCGCNPTRDSLFDESSPYNPYMKYGLSKQKMELFVKQQHKRGLIETVILRPMWFYGPHQPQRQTLFFDMIRHGKAPIIGDGSNKRSMTYIDNLVQAIKLAIIKDRAAGETYWIADDRPYSMNEIIDTIEHLLENEFHQTCDGGRFKLPHLASNLAFHIDKGLQTFGLYNSKIHVLSEMNKTIACTIDKAKNQLGYAPTISLEEGMRRSLKEWLC